MPEFWEENFKEKQEMWGSAPADAAVVAAELFASMGIRKVLIPGFGYGRNAKVFMDRGCEVTGIEISESAIAIARREMGEGIKVYHGGVGEMPFDQEAYEGIFCYALIHLLNAEERMKLIRDCFHQLAPGGCMVFVTLSKGDARYGQGTEVAKDSFLTQHGVTLFFYDLDSIEAEFGNYGLSEAEEINEPSEWTEGMPRQRFWWIACLKGIE